MSTDFREPLEGACIIRQPDGSFFCYVHGPNLRERGRGYSTTMIEALAFAIDASNTPTVTDAMIEAFDQEYYNQTLRPVAPASRAVRRAAIAAAMKAGEK